MEATGISLHDVKNNKIYLLKEPLTASKFIKKKAYLRIFENISSEVSVISHNRLATNGSNAYIENNHPIAKNNVSCVQNGIVTNVDLISKQFNKNWTLDTYAILELFISDLNKGYGVEESIQNLWKVVEGENTIIFTIANQKKLVHTTNSGTLYYIDDMANGLFVSCSEKHIMNLVKVQFNINAPISHLKPGMSLVVDYSTNTIKLFENHVTSEKENSKISSLEIQNNLLIDLEDSFYNKLLNLKRCTKCVLPETFPGISFDTNGICNQCNNYHLIHTSSLESLKEIFDKYRSKDGSADCLVAFSGGRDSSYGLHLIKNKYKMNPVAYSYDWGMVTDLARRNQARLCGKLGVEHVWVSADMKLKRTNIRKNVEAWIKNPHVGMVPLFMVGDKTYFYHANRVMKNMDLKLIIFCPNNLERTNFKASYCGITKNDFGSQVHQLKLTGKLKLVAFYALQYLKNPRYINSSISDVIAGFLSYYVMNQDFLYLFDYEKWDEREIDALLKKEYDWEWDPNYPSSWRIGDGTAPLYNMIYFMHAGFTENDCFRSNQIREGVITRQEALERIAKENAPRFKEVEEYCKLISVDFVDLINAIRRIRYDIS
ncbi:hypothetical protein [Candidatus Tisiphia endosymbiont of Nemotelus uliginosus]|uniref:hypothetical protein n=1 Tax=Candidatus Tisiphia endosymbiont of Nemotelus uliginosus TaxID=3077926 RepID=UPI0035C8B999